MKLGEFERAFKLENWPQVVSLGLKLAKKKPCPPQVLSGLGIAYHQSGRWREAVKWLTRAVRQDSDYAAELYRFLGEAEQKLGHHAAAFVALTQALRLAKRTGRVGDAFAANVLAMKGKSALRLGKVRRAATCFYRAHEKAVNLYDHCQMYSSYLLSLNSLPIAEGELFAAHLGYEKIFEAVDPLPPRKRSPGEKIRIGFLSPDFHRHIAFFFYYQLLAGYDRRQFEFYGYSLDNRFDNFTDLCQKCFTLWRDVSGLSIEDAARRIYDDEIDILIDLAGHCSKNGLPIMAYRPAPAQISALGYMATTGLSAVRYVASDKFIDPPERETYCLSEEPLRFRSLFCYTGLSNLPAAQGAPCEKTGRIVLGCFNQYHKITDGMLVIWREIMRLLPDSRLLLKNMSFKDEKIIGYAKRRLARLDFPADRVILEPGSQDYMERYFDVDIALDTFPYTGGGTTCEALYMGVPVVSLYGERRGSRFGLSILTSVGLGELAVNSADDYVKRILSLASDRNFLTTLHKNLRPMMLNSSLMDTGHYVREWEEKLKMIYERSKRDKI